MSETKTDAGASKPEVAPPSYAECSVWTVNPNSSGSTNPLPVADHTTFGDNPSPATDTNKSVHNSPPAIDTNEVVLSPASTVHPNQAVYSHPPTAPRNQAVHSHFPTGHPNQAAVYSHTPGTHNNKVVHYPPPGSGGMPVVISASYAANANQVVLAQPGVRAAIREPYVDVPNYTALAVFGCCCCTCLGLASIYKVRTARKLKAAGRYMSALKDAQSARNLAIAAIIVGTLLSILYIGGQYI